MKNAKKSPAKVLTSPRRKLYLAVAAQLMLSAGAHAGPSGGKVTGGAGVIDQNGANTTITQSTHRLSLDWDSFDVDAGERVEFIQPDSSSVALNRILSSDASNIFGQLDANGHVILMNPNGIIFGKDARVNVGGLVASGLAINPDDFMNGDFAFRAIDGTDGAVINHGVINAATGGNVALMGKSVENRGLISAKLGTVTLAAGKDTVLTFDDSGMLGVRVTEEVLQNEIGVDAVNNSGTINAEGGKILLTGSVSQDIFTKAVNAGEMNAKASVVVHDDGSFTLGGGADVVNTGTLNVASETEDAGDVVVLGENVTHSGSIHADSTGTGSAGHVEVHSQNTTLLSENSTISASAVNTGQGGDVKVLGGRVGVFDNSTIDASGLEGGGNINIGGGFQGKTQQLRNAERTVITRDTTIDANAVESGDGGEVIVWANETTAFTGEIDVRAGELSGDGGFVEVSGKKSLKFDGRVDRAAVAGENGTLLLDPEDIIIDNDFFTPNQDALLDDQQILFDEVGTTDNLAYITGQAISDALDSGDVILQASNSIEGLSTSSVTISPADANNTNSLIMEAGNSIRLGQDRAHFIFDLGAGDVIMNAGLTRPEGAVISGIMSFRTTGNVLLRSADSVQLQMPSFGPTGAESYAGNVDVRAGQYIEFYGGRGLGSARIAGDFNLTTGDLASGLAIDLPSGEAYTLPNLELATATDDHYGQILASRDPEGTGDGGAADFLVGGDINIKSVSDAELSYFNFGALPEAGTGVSGDAVDIVIDALGDIILPSTMTPGAIELSGGANEAVRSLSAISSQGSISFAEMISTTGGLSLAGNLTLDAARDISLSPMVLTGASQAIDLIAGRNIGIGEVNSGANGILGVQINAGGTTTFGGDIYTNAGDFYASSQSFAFADGITISTEGARPTPGNIEIRSSEDVVLPTVLAGGQLFVGSQAGSITASDVVAGEQIRFTSGAGISLNNAATAGNLLLEAGVTDCAVFDCEAIADRSPSINLSGSIAAGGDIYLNSANDITLPTLINARSLTANAAASILAVGGGRDITLEGDLFFTSGNESIYQDRSVGGIGFPGLQRTLNNPAPTPQAVGGVVTGAPFALSYLNTNGGNVTIQSESIGVLMEEWVLDTSSSNGHGDIRIDAPTIELGRVTSGVAAEGDREWTISLSGTTINAFPNEVNVETDNGLEILTNGFDYNNSGNLNLELTALDGGSIAVGRIFDSVPGDGDSLNLNSESAAETTFSQNGSIATGGGSVNVSAGILAFAEGVQINTESLNATGGTLNGAGNVSVTELTPSFPDDNGFETSFFLPEIATLSNCEASACGDLFVSAQRAIVSEGRTLNIAGSARFDTGSDLILGAGADKPIFGGTVSGSAVGRALIGSNVDLTLGDWVVGGDLQVAATASPDGGAASINAMGILDIAGFSSFSTEAGGSVILSRPESSFRSELSLSTSSVDLTYAGDLTLGAVGLLVDPSAPASRFSVDGSLTASGAFTGGLDADFLPSATASSIVFDVTGDLNLTDTGNLISAIEIASARNVELSNSSDLDIVGINAANFTFNATDAISVSQSGAITVSGQTQLNAGEVFGVEGVTEFHVENAANDFNIFNANVGQAVVYLDEANDIILGDISNSILFEVTSHSLAGSIRQAEDSAIDIGGSQLNLYAANLNLGAGGTAAINLGDGTDSGGTLNANTGSLTIEGAIGDGFLSIQSLSLGGEALALERVNIAASADLSTLTAGSNISMSGADAIANVYAALPFSLRSFAENSTVNLLADGAGATEIDFSSGTGVSTVTAFDTENTWRIDDLGNTTLTSGGNQTEIIGANNLVGGSANDIFSFAAFDADSTISVAGGDGAGIDAVDYSQVGDAIDLALGGVGLGGITGIERLIGNNADSTLRIDAESLTANTWQINGAESSVTIGDEKATMFDGFTSLFGGGGVDEFNIVTSLPGIIEGGAGDDVFIQAAADVSATILGGDGVDTLTRFEEGDAAWAITGLNSGTLELIETTAAIEFNDVENLAGDAGVDNVVFAPSSSIGIITTGAGDDTLALDANATFRSIDGGAGTNRVQLDGDTATVNVRGEAELLNDLITNFIATAAEGARLNVVGLEDMDAEWNITGDGTINVVVDGVTYTHENVVNLQGGSGVDTFVLQQGGSIVGSVIGQGDTDTLHADNGQDNQWTISGINSGELNAADDGTTLVFEGINNLIGSEGSDEFNIVTGGAFSGSVGGVATGATALAGSVDSLIISNPELTNTWTLSDVNTVESLDALGNSSVFAFSNIQTLGGNDNIDTVDVSASEGSVNLLTSETAGYDILNMDDFISSGGTLTGTNFDSEWLLDLNGSVSYSDAAGNSRVVTFENFGAFLGGEGSDDFVVQGVWHVAPVSVIAYEGVGSTDTVRLDIAEKDAAWSFNSSDQSALYIDSADNAELFGLNREDVVAGLGANSFTFIGVEEYTGGMGSDAFFVYSDDDLFGEEFHYRIFGNGGEDYIVALNWGNPADINWNITEDFGGTLNRAISFSETENLKSFDFIEGKPDTLSSSFTVADGVTMGRLVGNSTTDTFLLGAGAVVGSINGGAGTDTLFAGDAEKSWTLDAIGGSVGASTFTGIETLTGGATTDTFTLTSATTEVTTIDGGADSFDDRIISADTANVWALDADSSGTLNEALSFSNIDVLQGGADVDTIIGGNRANDWTVSADFTGNLNGLLAFENIENITGNAGADNVAVAAAVQFGDISTGAGDDTVDLGAGVSVGNLDGGLGDNLVSMADGFTVVDVENNPLNAELPYLSVENFAFDSTADGPVTIHSLPGSDTTWSINGEGSVEITYIDTDGVQRTVTRDNVARLVGGTGQDDFILLAGGALADGIAGSEGGSDSLNAANGQDNVWTINGADAGDLATQSDGNVLLFEGIANLIGGADSDVFNITTGGSISGQISGLAEGAAAVAGSIDELRVSDIAATNLWTLDEQNVLAMAGAEAGDVEINFSNIQRVVGNNNNDQFTFIGATSVVDVEGGLGENTLSWDNGDVVVDLVDSTLTGAEASISLSDITNYQAAAGSSNAMRGWDGRNAWQINDQLEGSIEGAEGQAANFVGFNSLQGSGADVLLGEGAAGTLVSWQVGEMDVDGPLDINRVNFDGADAITFAGMSDLVGSAADDRFVVFTEIASIDGGAGANSLSVGKGDAIVWQLDALSGSVATESESFAVEFANVQSVGTDALNPSRSTFYINDLDTIVREYEGHALNTSIVSFANLEQAVTFNAQDSGFSFVDIDTYEGNGADSVYVARDDAGTWFVEGDTAAITGAFIVRNFGTLQGGAGDDQFVLEGNSTLNLRGGAGVDTIVGLGEAGEESVWDLTGDYQGTYDGTLAFTEMENIEGSAANDVVHFGEAMQFGDISLFDGDDQITLAAGVSTGLLDGGEGSNILFTGALGSVIDVTGVQLEGDAAYEATNFTQDATGAEALTIFALADSDTTWTIDAEGSVVISYVDAEGVAHEGITYSNVARLEGGTGADEFIVLDGGSLTAGINGGAGGDDSLSTLSETQNYSWSINGENSGELALSDGGTALLFDDIANLVGGSGNDSFSIVTGGSIGSIVGGAGVDTLTVGDQTIANVWQLGATNSNDLVGAFAGIESVVGNELADTFNYADGTDVVAIDGGAGESNALISADALAVNVGSALLDDSVSFASVNQFTAAAGSIIGADQASTWTLTAADAGTVATATDSVDFIGFNSLTGGSAEDTLVGSDAGAAYLISDENAGIMDANTTFSGIENLVGGAGDDSYTLDAAGAVVSIDGGAGADSLRGKEAAANTWSVGEFVSTVEGVTEFSGVETLYAGDAGDTFAMVASGDVANIVGGAGSDTVTSENDNLWTINSDAADLNGVAISAVEALRGGAGSDDYIVVADPTSALDLDGGEGENTLAGAGEVNTWRLASNTLNETITFASIDSLIGSGADVLVAANTANDWNIIGDNAGELNSTAFNGMAELQGGDAVDQFTVSTGVTLGDIRGNGGDDTVTLGDNVVVQGSILGGDGDDTLDISAFSSAIEYNYDTKATNQGLQYDFFETVVSTAGSGFYGGAGDTRWVFTDTGSFYIEKLDAEGNVVETSITYSNEYDNVRGGEGRNNFILADDSNFDGSIRGDAAGNNSLQGSNLINQWLITGANSGSVSDGNVTTVFSGIATLVGSDSAADTFTLAEGGAVAAISAGNSAGDSIVLDHDLQSAWQFDGIQDQLTVDTATVAFDGIEAAVGSQGGNNFVFVDRQSLVNSIEGGAGEDTLDLSAIGQAEVNLQNNTAADINFAQIERFTGDSTQHNTIVGMDAVASWTITAEDAGLVDYEASGDSYEFSGFVNATGGALNDDFAILTDPLAGITDGGAGENTLTAGNIDNVWELGASSSLLNQSTFQNISSVTGGSEADDFVLVAATAQVQTLAGGLGSNSLTGFDQDNIWTINADNSGSVTGLASFSDIQTFNGGSAADTMNLAEGTQFIAIDSGAGDDIVNIANGVTGESIRTGSGSDTLTMEGLVSLASIDMGSDAGADTSVDTIDLKDLDAGDEIADLSDAELIAMLGFALTGQEQFIRPEIGIIYAGDGFNVWHITGRDEGYFVRTDAEGNVEQVAFSNKHTLRGGAGQDVFVFASDEAAVSTLIEGGTGDNRIALTWSEGGEASVQNLINEWLISGENQGSFSNEANTAGNVFADVNSIIGGGNSDNFVFAQGAMLAGVLDGSGGQDSLNLEALNQDMTIRLDDAAGIPAAATALDIRNINQLTASGQQQTVLLGASDQAYTWVINSANSGEVTTTMVDANSQLLAFENITAITGGGHDDVFNVLTNNNAIALDGGAAQTIDTIDYSGVNANLRVALAELNGFELIRGNNAGIDSINSAELVGADNANTWTIGGSGDGINDGQLTSDGNSVQFENFNILSGGAEADVFNQTKGVIIGELRGGAGNDVLNASIAGDNRGTTFIGGTGNDSLNLSGASAEHSLVYTAGLEGGAFEYKLGELTYTVAHQAAEAVSEATAAMGLEVRGTSALDSIAVGDGFFAVNGNAAITHVNKEDVLVRAGISDIIEIAENITLAGSFGVINGTVVSNDPGNTSIVAQRLLLENTRDVGAFNGRIRTNVDDVTLVNVTGDVFLQEQNGLNLAGISTNGELDLVLVNGDLSNSEALSAGDDLRVLASDGDILLTGDNQFQGDLTLTADAIDVSSASSMTFASIDAESLKLSSQGALNAEGAVTVAGETELSAIGNIDMVNELNDFNRLAVTQGQDVSIVDRNGIELAGINTSGRFNLSASGIVVGGNINSGSSTQLLSQTSIEQNGSIKAGANVVASAENGDVLVAEGATTEGSNVSISASGNLQLQEINGESIQISGGELVVSGGSLVASNGDINVQSGSFNMSVGTALTATEGSIRIAATDNVSTNNDITGDAVAISGNDVTLDGNVKAEKGSVDVSAGGNLDVKKDITADSDVKVSAATGSVNQTGNISSDKGSVDVSAGSDGNVAMGADAVTEAKAGNVTVSAGQDVVVATIKASDTAKLDSTSGGIIDGNGTGTNVTSDKLVTQSERGLGEGDALETDTRNIDSNSNSGDVNVDNSGDVKVERLATGGGNVDFNNKDGDVTLGGGSVVAKGKDGGSSVNIDVDRGSVKSDGPQGGTAITSDRVAISAPDGAVGEGDFYIDSLNVFIAARSRGGFVTGPKGGDIDTYFSGSFKFEDQLLAVEPLNEVNPAVFTDVQGYFYNDISLRMPADQRYEEEE